MATIVKSRKTCESVFLLFALFYLSDGAQVSKLVKQIQFVVSANAETIWENDGDEGKDGCRNNQRAG